MKKLGINGKVVDITNIASKSKAQFAAQLKQAGVILDEARLESVYTTLHDQAVDEEATKDMTDEQKQAYFAERHPELTAEREARRAEAEQKARMAREYAEHLNKQRAASLAKMKTTINH